MKREKTITRTCTKRSRQCFRGIEGQYLNKGIKGNGAYLLQAQQALVCLWLISERIPCAESFTAYTTSSLANILEY